MMTLYDRIWYRPYFTYAQKLTRWPA